MQSEESKPRRDPVPRGEDARKSLDFIIPIFNEEECLDQLMLRLTAVWKDLSVDYVVRLIFVDDGSRDKSYQMLANLAAKLPYVLVIKLSRNFGHQVAVTAGLDHADADWVVIIDADLQDPPELVRDMLKTASASEANVVYAQRRHRAGESAFKLATAKVFYKLLRWMCDLDIPADTGDFRLIDRKVLLTMQSMREHHRFLRGMVPWVGFKSEPFLYDRDTRFAGVTKYSLRKMIRLAFDAALSFSKMPLRVATASGFFVLAAGIIAALYMIVLKLFTDQVVPGLTAILTLMTILGGVQIIILGLIGEYVGRLFEEAKGRPLYIVDDRRNIPHALAAPRAPAERLLADAVTTSE